MPADDKIADAVRAALVKDGWTITHDPYTLRVGGVRVYTDLGAEKVFAAERGVERIAVEVKSFTSPSPIHDFEQALGQFRLYWSLIRRADPGRKLYLAVDHDTEAAVFGREGIRIVLEDNPMPRVVILVRSAEVVSWIG